MGYYLSVNRNKRDIRLVRRRPGAEVLERLLVASDVLIENFRAAFCQGWASMTTGSMPSTRGSCGYPSWATGPTGPDSHRPGFDFIIQAVSGLMSITGMPDAEGGGPTKVGVAIADLTTGMLGAVAILAAVGRTGTARQGGGSAAASASTSSLGFGISWFTKQATNHLIGGEVPTRMGNRTPTSRHTRRSRPAMAISLWPSAPSASGTDSALPERWVGMDLTSAMRECVTNAERVAKSATSYSRSWTGHHRYADGRRPDGRPYW